MVHNAAFAFTDAPESLLGKLVQERVPSQDASKRKVRETD